MKHCGGQENEYCTGSAAGRFGHHTGIDVAGHRLYFRVLYPLFRPLAERKEVCLVRRLISCMFAAAAGLFLVSGLAVLTGRV